MRYSPFTAVLMLFFCVFSLRFGFYCLFYHRYHPEERRCVLDAMPCQTRTNVHVAVIKKAHLSNKIHALWNAACQCTYICTRAYNIPTLHISSLNAVLWPAVCNRLPYSHRNFQNVYFSLYIHLSVHNTCLYVYVELLNILLDVLWTVNIHSYSVHILFVL